MRQRTTLGSTVLPGKEMCSCMHMYNLGPRDVLSPPLHLSLIPLLRPGVRGGGREEGRKDRRRSKGGGEEFCSAREEGGEIVTTCILETSFPLLPISTVHSLIPLPMLVH